MQNNINMNKEDMELDEIFHGEEKPLHPNTIHTTLVKPTAQKPTSKPAKAKNTVADAEFAPAMPEPNWLDKLKACAKSVAMFAGLCVLLFYWQQTGQMQASAAVPSMCVCFLLAGLSIGKNTARGYR